MNDVFRQMKRGCGYVAIHYATFTPKAFEDRFLDWDTQFTPAEDKGGK
jgi:hypothetical protein